MKNRNGGYRQGKFYNDGGTRMLSSAAHAYNDPDHYAASAHATTLTMTLTARGHFNAHLTKMKLHHLWLQRFSELYQGLRTGLTSPGEPSFRFVLNLDQRCSRLVQKWGRLILFGGEKLRIIFSNRTGRFPLAQYRSQLPKWLPLAPRSSVAT